MTIAEQIKARYTLINPATGEESIDFGGMATESQEIASVTHDWDTGSTEYQYADGSVIVWHEDTVLVYGAAQ